MSLTISFTDGTGAATLTHLTPRWGAWRPDIDSVADRHVAVGTGITYAWEMRVDDTVDFEVRDLQADDLAVALRLKRHLVNGGTAVVATGDLDANSYTIRLRPGTVPELRGPDPDTMYFVLAVAAKRASGSGTMAAPYERDGRS